MDGAIFKERIAALLHVMQATKIIREDNIPCKIEEGLYLGSLGAANNKSALKSLNITHILTVAHSLSPAYPNDFVYKTIPVMDREDVDISQYFSECFNFIEEAKTTGGGVLVHCFAGKSRRMKTSKVEFSPVSYELAQYLNVTIVVAYLMMKNGMSLSEALECVKRKRPVISPNSGFISQLKDFERSLQGSENRIAFEAAAIHKYHCQ